MGACSPICNTFRSLQLLDPARSCGNIVFHEVFSMIDVFQNFWDLFFYPLFQLDMMTEVFYCLSCMILVFAVIHFVERILNRCM